MAQESVQFHKFARWVYTVLNCVAEEREMEMEFQSALQRHLQMINDGKLAICVGFFAPSSPIITNAARCLSASVA
jgi:hypothetical protein